MLAMNKLVIRRRNLRDDAMEKISIFFPESDNTSGVTLIDVQFLGEEGLDGGGVKREFFCKSFEKSVHKLMAGGENMLTFRRDAHLLEEKAFENYGKLMSLALINKCDGPHNWCKSLTHYMLDPEDNTIEYEVDAIPDGDIKRLILDLKVAPDQESIHKLLANELLTDARFDAGFNNSTVDFNQKDDLIQKIAKHYIISKQLEEIQSVMKGLQLGGILNIIRHSKSEAVTEFVYSDDHLSPAQILNMFVIKYSEDQKKKEKEVDIIYNVTHFLDYLKRTPFEIEALDYEKILSMNEAAAKDVDDGGLVGIEVKLEDVLQFLTGSKFFTNLKDMKGEISFCHKTGFGKRVKINTCGAGIIVPVTDRYMLSSSFSQNFAEDIIASPGFGSV